MADLHSRIICSHYYKSRGLLRESLIIQSRAEVRKIYGRILSKLRRNTDVFQGDLARLCREDYVLMRGWEFFEVPLNLFTDYNDQPFSQQPFKSFFEIVVPE